LLALLGVHPIFQVSRIRVNGILLHPDSALNDLHHQTVFQVIPFLYGNEGRGKKI